MTPRPIDCIPILNSWYVLIVQAQAFAEDRGNWLVLRNGQTIHPEATTNA